MHIIGTRRKPLNLWHGFSNRGDWAGQNENDQGCFQGDASSEALSNQSPPDFDNWNISLIFRRNGNTVYLNQLGPPSNTAKGKRNNEQMLKRHLAFVARKEDAP